MGRHYDEDGNGIADQSDERDPYELRAESDEPWCEDRDEPWNWHEAGINDDPSEA